MTEHKEYTAVMHGIDIHDITAVLLAHEWHEIAPDTFGFTTQDSVTFADRRGIRFSCPRDAIIAVQGGTLPW